MNNHVTLPYLDLTGQSFATLTVLPDERRWQLLDQLLTHHGHQRDDIPDAWKHNPLQAWCWLVLTLNDLDPDPDRPRPLLHWGIDMSLTDAPIRAWVWAIS